MRPAPVLPLVALAWISSVAAPVRAEALGLRSLRGRQIPLILDAGPFPRSGHPNVLAYVPRGFSGSEPIDLVVFAHGWHGCAQVIMNDEQAPCESGGDATHAYHLADLMDASGKDAILLLLQGPYDARSNDDGTLARPGAFAAIVDESLRSLARVAGAPSDAAPAVGNIQVVGHSGAVVAVADILDVGGLDGHIVEVDMLDSLYTRGDSYARWLDRQAAEAAHDRASRRRLVVIYTDASGTADLSLMLARRPLPTAPGRTLRVVGRTTGGLSSEDLSAPILILGTEVPHDALPLAYFEPLVATSALRDAFPSSDPAPKPR